MYYVQNVWTGHVIHCTMNEAWFWAKINDECFMSLAYNIYKQGGSMQLLSAAEIR